jgi:hypothetical protein
MKPWLWAALGGTVAALGVWALVRRGLDNALERGGADLRERLGAGGADLERQLTRARNDLGTEIKVAVLREVPPQVEQTIRSTLTSYGITPDTGRRLDLALAAAERLGVL